MPDGTAWAYSHMVDGERWLELPGVGGFHLGDRADEVTAYPEKGTDEDALQDAYRRIVVPIAFQAHGAEVFHASAVFGPFGVVAFCADSLGGKSTMAYAMGRRGHGVWADDAVALDFSGDAIAAVKLPFVLRLRPPAARFFLGTERAADYEPKGEEKKEAPTEPAVLSAVFFLERGGQREADPAPAATRLAPGDAFTRVLAQAFCFTLQDVDRKELMVRHYLDLSATVPFFTLRVPTGLERIGEAVDCIELALANSARATCRPRAKRA